MKMLLPYDEKRILVEIPDQNFVGSLVSKVESYEPRKSPQELVEASLDRPIGSPKLEELVKDKKHIVIISSDHTRPVPSQVITPILLRRIRSAQPDANIKIVVAAGFHRPPTRSAVGYFVLVGRRGIIIGDRVQISGVTGDGTDIGWLQFQLKEIDTRTQQPTGNVVTFSNSFVLASPATRLSKFKRNDFDSVRLEVAAKAPQS
ncbi:MAG: lactate racemase domain-containing protein [Candidatus Sulfotelmatobacter sp.]